MCKDMEKYPRHIVKWKINVTKWSIGFVLIFNVAEHRG